jgi:hypothetical protein
VRIDELRADDVPTGRRVSARLVFEGRARAPATLWYETDPAFAADLDAAPEGFLIAGAMVAVHHHEPRVRIDAPVCPRLVAGLEDVLRLHTHWNPAHPTIPVEAGGGRADLRPRTPTRTAAFVSGGVDSLSLLGSLARAFPPGHPRAVRDGFFVAGMGSYDVRDGALDPERLRAWNEQRVRLEGLAAGRDFTLVPVRTNARALFADFHGWAYLGFGPALLAIAHCFRRRVSEAWLAAHGYGPGQAKYGSHPLVDPNLSSGAVEVHCGEPMRMRHEKLADVAASPDALAVLQVCTQATPLPPGVVNCGRCEKCLRTRMGLLVLGRLDRATTFAGGDLAAEELTGYSPASDPKRLYSGPLVAGLAAVGRDDLVRVLRARIARADRRARPLAKWLRRVRRALRGG